MASAPDTASRPRPGKRPIRLTGVRQNNLKSFDVEFPHKKLTVVTGLSGSGKSSLAFDTLYAEGQRRYIESLSTYTRQFLEKMPKPDVDQVENIPPSIALEQRNHVVNSRSTVGTQTEIVDYLRVLYARAGQTYCKVCNSLVRKVDAESILQEALEWFPGRKGVIAAPVAFSETAVQTAKKVSAKKSKASKKKAPSLLSLFQVLREQGYRRMLWQISTKKREILDLEDLESDPLFKEIPEAALQEQKLWVVLDRLKLSSSSVKDKDVIARLFDSIGQAIQVGRGKVSFFDLEGQKPSDQRHFECAFACSKCGEAHRLPEPNLFSFNSPLGACQRCSGFGYTLDLDESKVVPDPSRTLYDGAIDPLAKPSTKNWEEDMFKFAEEHGISTGKRYSELNQKERELIWKGEPERAVGDGSFPGIEGIFRYLGRSKYKLHMRVFIRRYQSQVLCADCGGSRLQKEALGVRIADLNIAQVLDLSVEDAEQWILKLKLKGEQAKIAADVFDQVKRRLHFLNAVGVGYLTLSRLAKTLSGGEFQRINLATQLGNGLCGTLYVLDEPSIGLHAADTERLIGVLEDLRNQGNTVVVVEHDLEVMRKADYLVELGPGSGRRGGELLGAGTAQELEKIPGSLTGKYLNGSFRLEGPRSLRGPTLRHLKITGCRENNLQNITAELPLERFVVVTGVSGSGKTTLVHRTLYQALNRIFEKSHSAYGRQALGNSHGSDDFGRFDRLYGAENISGVVLLDQKPIGKSSRSNPATYIKAWDEIRRIYANQVMSLRRGYTPQYFSFNVDGGRCPVCKGEGEITLDMHFMADVSLPCEECQGRRFKKNILDITYKNKNVHQLLNTSIDEAFDLFRDNAVLVRKLGLLRDVGLGYLQIGQSATTLSGGESQRLKVAAALDSKDQSRLMYIFDEPTTGLHNEDIKKLMRVVHDLVDAHNSVVMIEHHLDVIAQADWVLDLGPGGGERGGRLIAAGTPQQLAENPDSVTGRMLKAGNHPFPENPVTRAREMSLS